jgi:SAM-dependent methyltransferase
MRRALPKEPAYYAGCNEALLRAVPQSARRVLDVGCAEGKLASALKGLRHDREVFGIEREPEVALRAAARIDRVFTIDVEAESPPLEQGSIDCILFGRSRGHAMRLGRAVFRWVAVSETWVATLTALAKARRTLRLALTPANSAWPL